MGEDYRVLVPEYDHQEHYNAGQLVRFPSRCDVGAQQVFVSLVGNRGIAPESTKSSTGRVWVRVRKLQVHESLAGVA